MDCIDAMSVQIIALFYKTRSILYRVAHLYIVPANQRDISEPSIIPSNRCFFTSPSANGLDAHYTYELRSYITRPTDN